MDMSKIKADLFIPSMMIPKRTITDCRGCGRRAVCPAPTAWWSTTSKATDYADLCAPENAGKVSMRLKWPHR
jgi:spermidine/putrescine transport system substrate-binding protein